MSRCLRPGIFRRTSSSRRSSLLCRKKTLSHLKALEQEHITEVYRRTGFNQTETARLLGISRTTLWRRLKDLNLFSEK